MFIWFELLGVKDSMSLISSKAVEAKVLFIPGQVLSHNVHLSVDSNPFPKRNRDPENRLFSCLMFVKPSSFSTIRYPLSAIAAVVLAIERRVQLRARRLLDRLRRADGRGDAAPGDPAQERATATQVAHPSLQRQVLVA
jgi:hypothetical protein